MSSYNQGWEHSQTKGVYDEGIAKSKKAFWECPLQLGICHPITKESKNS